MKRLRRFLASYAAPGLAGALFLLAMGRFGEPGSSRLALFLMGWLYGVAVGALVRAFPTSPSAYPLAGLFVGPLPAALLWSGAEDGVAVWVVTAVLGVAIGVFERVRSSAEG